MHKRMKFRAVVFIRSAAFVMVLCMMIGSLGIPVFAEEKSGDLKNSSENVESDTLIKNEMEEAGDKAFFDNNTQEKELDEGGSEEISGNDMEEKEPEESGSKEISGNNTEEKDPEEGGSEAVPGKEEGDDADAGDNIGEQKPEESLAGDHTEEDKKGIGQETVSGNDTKGNDTEEIKEKERTAEKEKNDEKPETLEIPEIINVVVPTAYILALNPYQLPVRVGEDVISTEQIISGMYGIVNKSSRDKIVTVSFIVEDRTEGELLFVDSAEEAQNAGKNVYAVYLAAVPANEEQVLIDGQPIDSNVSGESLQNVEMTGSQEQAVTLYAGVNQIAFRLSGAIYGPESEEELENEEEPENEEELENEEEPENEEELKSEGEPENKKELENEEDPENKKELKNEENPENEKELENEESLLGEDVESDADLQEEKSEEVTEIVLKDLAPDGKGVAAYTFYGIMNPDAEWEKLPGGIRLSVVYTYQEADGSEEIIDGTGAMIYID